MGKIGKGVKSEVKSGQTMSLLVEGLSGFQKEFHASSLVRRNLNVLHEISSECVERSEGSWSSHEQQGRWLDEDHQAGPRGLSRQGFG